MKFPVSLRSLIFSGAVLLAFSTTAAEPSSKSAWLDLGPLLGHVSSTNALLWAKASGPAKLSVRVGQQADLSDGTVVAGPQLEAETDFMAKALVPNLQPAHRYYYCLLCNSV